MEGKMLEISLKARERFERLRKLRAELEEERDALEELREAYDRECRAFVASRPYSNCFEDTDLSEALDAKGAFEEAIADLDDALSDIGWALKKEKRMGK